MRYPFVLDHPIVNVYFWYQLSTQILDKKLNRILEHSHNPS